MFSISDIKARAKAAFQANYWPCVAVALLFAVFCGSCRFNFNVPLGDAPASHPEEPYRGSHCGAADATPAELAIAEEASCEVEPSDAPATVWHRLANFFPAVEGDNPRAAVAFVAVLAVVFLLVFLVGIALRFCVFNPLAVGCSNFFLRNTSEKASFNAVGLGFRDWKRVVWSMFLRDIFLFLWWLPALVAFLAPALTLSPLLVRDPHAVERRIADHHAGWFDCFPLVFFGLLFAGALLVIPVIVKTYSYRLVPYLLADNPALSGRAAIDRSRELMHGNKGHAFLLDLSFIGWILLSLLTCGILLVFYVNPYIQCANAELYRALVPAPDRPPVCPPPLPPLPEPAQ